MSGASGSAQTLSPRLDPALPPRATGAGLVGRPGAQPVIIARRRVAATRPSRVGRAASAMGNKRARGRPAVPQRDGVGLPGRSQLVQQRRVGRRRAASARPRPPPAAGIPRVAAGPRNPAARRRVPRGGWRPRSAPASASVRAERSSSSVPSAGRLASSSPSGRKRHAKLDQRAGQVVDRVQREVGDHQVEAGGREGQPFRHRPTTAPSSRAIAGESSQLTVSMPRARSRGATTPRPPRSSARVKRRVMSSSRSSSRSATSSRIGATCATVGRRGRGGGGRRRGRTPCRS